MRTTLLATSALLASPAFAVDVIVNEWNAVNDTKWLNSADTAACTGPAGISCATDQDNFFGRIMGNGSDWIELVVVNDHVDMRGWRLQWVAGVGVAAVDAPPVGNGNDIWWGDGSTAQGEIVLSQAAVWSDVRAGTIITLIQNTAAQGGLDTDLSFDPCRGDWWINVNINDAALCEPVSNVAAELAVGRRLHVSEDNFWVRIVDDEGNEHIGLIGENSFGWPASGVNSREVGKLEADPTPTISIYSNYQDANHSTFGSPNPGRSTPARTSAAPACRTWIPCAPPCARSSASPATRSPSTSTTPSAPPPSSAAAPPPATPTCPRASRPTRSSAAWSATAATGSSW